MANSPRAFGGWQRISIRHLGDTISLLLALSIGLPWLACPLLATQLMITLILPTAPTWEQREAATIPPQTGQHRITIVVIRGNRRIPSSTLRKSISIHIGNIYEPAKIERDVTALKNTGYFDEVRAVTTDDPTGTKDGKMVTFYVREKKDLVLPHTP